MQTLIKPCPCHSGTDYAKCCQPLHQGQAPTKSLDLMRARYSAYALSLVDYIVQTTHSSRKLDLEAIQNFCATTQFVGLEILDTSEDTVTFKAILKQGKIDTSFVETSTFVKENGRWVYESACMN